MLQKIADTNVWDIIQMCTILILTALIFYDNDQEFDRVIPRIFFCNCCVRCTLTFTLWFAKLITRPSFSPIIDFWLMV